MPSHCSVAASPKAKPTHQNRLGLVGAYNAPQPQLPSLVGGQRQHARACHEGVGIFDARHEPEAAQHANEVVDGVTSEVHGDIDVASQPFLAVHDRNTRPRSARQAARAYRQDAEKRRPRQMRMAG